MTVIIIISPGPKPSGTNAVAAGTNNIINVDFVGDISTYTKDELTTAIEQALAGQS